jgi:hypothetical protein
MLLAFLCYKVEHVNLFLYKYAEHSEDEVKILLEINCMPQFPVRIIFEKFFALMNILASFARDARSSSNRHSCKVFFAVAQCKRI